MSGIRSGGEDQLSLCFILHRLKLAILLPYKLPTAAPRFLLLLITVPYGIVLGLFFLPQRDHGRVRATGEVNSRSFRLQRGCGSLSQHVSRRETVFHLLTLCPLCTACLYVVHGEAQSTMW